MKNLLQALLVWLLATTTSIAAVTQNNLLSYGARAGGGFDNYEALTNAITTTLVRGLGSLYIPSGRYLVTREVTLPSRLVMYGDPVDLSYKGLTPRQSVFYTTGTNTLFRTPELTFPNDTLPYWADFITLRDLYLEGPYLQGTAPSTGGAGLYVMGALSCRFQNLKIEGFSIGVVYGNCAEILDQNTFVQNCYYGMMDYRKNFIAPANYYDCLVTHNNTFILNNVVSLVLDNPRYSSFVGGEIINNLTNEVPKIKIQNVKDDSNIHISNFAAIENQADYPLIESDESGHGIFTLENSNCAVDRTNVVFRANGYFDGLYLRNNAYQRTITDNRSPIVWASGSGENSYLRGNDISVGPSHPNWFDMFVRNDQLGSGPMNDYPPPGWIQINPVPNSGSAGNDGSILLSGDYGFTTNSICGLARAFWRTTTTNNVYTFIADTNLTKNVTQIYVTATVYDNGGTNVPLCIVQGWGNQGTGWERISQAKIGSYTNPVTGLAFSKWAWSVVAKDPSVATNGLRWVQLFDIYGNPTDANRYGLERMCVYINQSQNPYVPRILTHGSQPDGYEGFHAPGNYTSIYWNDYSGSAVEPGWINRQYGQSSDKWDLIGNVVGPATPVAGTVPAWANTTNNTLRGSQLYTATNGNTSLGTADVSTYRLFITGVTTNSPMRIQGSSPAVQISDGVAYGNTAFALSPLNGNVTYANSLVVAPSGDITTGYSLTADRLIATTSITSPLLELTTMTTGTLTSTNGLLFLAKASGPTAASIGAGNGQLWLSNSSPPTLYFRYTTDGVSATDKLLSP